MNKLTKIGVSALCGSLASVASASAGTLGVSGSAQATWTSLGGQQTGNPLGMNSALSFTGSGELDNGSTFTVTFNHTDQVAWSGAAIGLTVPGVGTFTLDSGGGTGIDRVDDIMPTAWEESWGHGLGTGIQTVGGAGANMDIEWALSPDMLPDGMTAYISYSPKPDGSGVTDKSVGGDKGTAVNGSGYDVLLRSTGLYDGLDVWAGYSQISQDDLTTSTATGDRQATNIGAKYAIGSVTVGYQIQHDAVNARTSGTRYYDNEAWGVSFQVNDDLALSYNVHKSTRAVENAATADVELDIESLQLSYSMGGAAIKIATSSADNINYNNTGTTFDRDGTTVALTLAF